MRPRKTDAPARTDVLIIVSNNQAVEEVRIGAGNFRQEGEYQAGDGAVRKGASAGLGDLKKVHQGTTADCGRMRRRELPALAEWPRPFESRRHIGTSGYVQRRDA